MRSSTDVWLVMGVRRSSGMPSRPHRFNRIKGRKEGEERKKEEAERDGSLDGPAEPVAMTAGRPEVSSESCRAREPENGSDG